MNSRLFKLFDESNFDAYDRQRYPEVLEAGLTRNGLDMDDVLAVTQDCGLWAICKQGVFRADLRGVLKKRIEIDDLIPYADIEEARAKPSGPHTQKIVMLNAAGGKLAEIDFSAAGPDRTIEGARAQYERVLRIMETAWTEADLA